MVCHVMCWEKSKDYLEESGGVEYLSEELEMEMDQTGDMGIATLRYSEPIWSNGKVVVKEAQVLIQERMFMLDGEDNRDLMFITLEHELVELLVGLLQSRNNKSKRIPDGLAHKVAVLAEFRLAAERGLAERYLELMKKWSGLMGESEGKMFWEENKRAYEFVKENGYET